MSVANQNTPIVMNGKVIDKSIMSNVLNTRLGFRFNKIRSVLPPVKPVADKNLIPESILEQPVEQDHPAPEPVVLAPEPVAEPVAKAKIVTLPARDPKAQAMDIDLSNLEVPDFSSMTKEEQVKRREDLLLQARLYRDKETGNHTIGTDADLASLPIDKLFLLVKGFSAYVLIKKSMQEYRMYIWLVSILVEYSLYSLGLKNILGFTNIQMKNYFRFESCLEESSCKSIAATGGVASGINSWPPFLQICFVSLLHILMLLIARHIAGKFGLDQKAADYFVDKGFDFISGKTELPPEIMATATRGLAENPSNPFAGILGGLAEKFDFSQAGNFLSSLFNSGSSKPKEDEFFAG